MICKYDNRNRDMFKHGDGMTVVDGTREWHFNDSKYQSLNKIKSTQMSMLK